MKTLVIGGTGMVGSMVAAGLREQKVMVRVRVMSHSLDKLKRLPAGMKGFRADLDDRDTEASWAQAPEL
jgi:nucleoside-diphosphate-sugar epimerase